MRGQVYHGGVDMQILGCAFFAIFAVIQLWAAFVGADLYVGIFWGLVIFALCVVTRFTLPITVFGFLGAWKGWEWPWWGALLLTFPGLLIAVPSMFATVLGWLMESRRAR